MKSCRRPPFGFFSFLIKGIAACGGDGGYFYFIAGGLRSPLPLANERWQKVTRLPLMSFQGRINPRPFMGNDHPPLGRPSAGGEFI